MNSEINEFLERVRPAIDTSLDTLLPSDSTSPSEIHRAMRYSIFSGGKRLRPALCVAGYSVYQDDWLPVLPAASAIEMVHTYSLIHDDLPAMDDDDFRRGRPSCHKQFGEAIAILAGDGLLTQAFETLARCNHFQPNQLVEVIGRLSRASGTREGMIAGQVLDLQAEGRNVSLAEVDAIHRSKTGALFAASVWIGAFLGGARVNEQRIIGEYGERIGLAFQIVDDILDERAGNDRDQNKATYPALNGQEGSRLMVRKLTGEASQLVTPLGDRARVLVQIAAFLETRSH
jgi:geranylgeranyl diphosphate synthase type II